MAEPRIAIGVDVGGSGIKAAVVNADDGRFVSERLRVPTPMPSTPDAVNASIGRLVKRLVASAGVPADAPVGIGLPGVVLRGVLKTAANIDPTWVEFPITEKLSKALKRPVTIVNDADAAGTAEMRFGIGAGRQGVFIRGGKTKETHFPAHGFPFVADVPMHFMRARRRRPVN